MTTTDTNRRRFGRSPDDGEILRLAVPALGALVAEPLYILADTAVVGHLGTPQLGGLALASQVLLLVVAVFIFLAYGTTAAVGRLLGAGRHREAAHNAVQSLWLAVGVGVTLAAAIAVFAEPALRLLGGDGDVLHFGLRYLRISVLGLPAMLITLAGVGYLRGAKDTVRPLVVAVATAVGNLALELVLVYGFGFGVGASALSTVIMQWLGAVAYLVWIGRSVRAEGVSLAPDRRVIGTLAVAGGDLFVRTAALRGSIVVAAAVAARIGDADLAAHQITFEVWALFALGLDSIAIAGQAIVANRLGAGDGDGARRSAERMMEIGVGLGVVTAVAAIAARPWLPEIFTDDPAVISLTAFLLWFLAAQQPLNAVAFTLDGLLIGAGDLRFLAKAMAGAAVVFVAGALAVVATGAGIGWLWAALTVFMVARVIPLWMRFRSGRWAVVGATR